MNSAIPLHLGSLKWSAGGNDILHRIDIDVASREFIGILGPNGSGKSSLLRCIFRYIKPDSGVIRLNGKNIDDYTIKETAKQMATVLQERNSEFEFSVFHLVLMGRTPHKNVFEQQNRNDIKIAEEALQEVGMSEFRDRNIGTLSGGELQRTLLARALCQKAKLLILDEPTNHLDIRFQMEMMSLLKRLKITTIAALHELNLTALFCDKVYIISNGTIVAYGPPQEVLTEELIQSVYGVKVKVQLDSVTNVLNIAYLPDKYNRPTT